ncbi:MAG: hypothetical protein AAFO75_13745, partial [Pseudomonadota bacterium]
GFENEPRASPFDWRIGRGENASARVARGGSASGASGNRVLHITLDNARIEFPSIEQTIVLPAGEYLFRGKQSGHLVGPRGLRWRVTCHGNASPVLGQSQLLKGRPDLSWHDVEFRFKVPAKACAAQVIRIVLDARTSSETLLFGEVEFDDLQIRPQASF